MCTKSFSSSTVKDKLRFNRLLLHNLKIFLMCTNIRKCELQIEKKDTNNMHTMITSISTYVPIWENVSGHKEIYIALV